MVGNKIADKITTVIYNLNKVENEIPKGRYTSPEKRQQIIDELRLVQYINKMEHQKITNLLDNTSKQLFQFWTTNLVEISDDRSCIYDKKNIKFKTTILNASFCDHNITYILVEGRITVVRRGADAAAFAADRNNKGVVFKNCAPFVKCINKINNAEVDNAEDLDIVMPMYNLFEYSKNYAKSSASLWRYCRNEPDDNITDSKSFKFKSSITDNSNNDDIANLKIVVPFKYLSDFWRTSEMPLINCEVTL